jgi:hypothetical protein
MTLAVLDLSEKGIRLVVKEALRPAQVVTLNLEGPNHPRPLKFMAKAVWCVETAEHTFCVGLQFEKPLPYMDLHKMT